MAKELGKHDFSGSCDPTKGMAYAGMNTFSVGIFQWVATSAGSALGIHSDGKNLKKGKVKVRVSGHRSHAEAIHHAAAEICHWLDAGEYKGPKRVTVGTK